MKIEIRPAAQEEMAHYRHVALSSLVFSPSKGAQEHIQAIQTEMTLCAFVDGNLATSFAAWPLTMRFNGTAVPISGVTFVGTLPVYRNLGCLRQVMQKHFELLHEKGERPLAALYASQAEIYQRYGYGIVSTLNSYLFEPRYLAFVPRYQKHRPSGTLKELAGNEINIIKNIYRQFCSKRIGYLHRGRDMWESSILKPAKDGAFSCKLVYEENGVPLGYMVYTIEPREVPFGQPWQQITITELIWLTSDAYISLINFFSCMGIVNTINHPFVPPDDPLPHMLLEPRMLNIKTRDGLLGRIVDVDKTLVQRGYCATGQLVFNVIDDLCPWNEKRWCLETSDSGASLTQTDQNAEMTIPIDTLAMLVFGQISTTEAARMGRLDVLKHEALPKWDGLLRTNYRPFCANIF